VPKKRWRDRDHVFTAPNITRLEFIITFEVKETVPKRIRTPFKPRKQRRGKVKIIPVETYLEQNKGGESCQEC
jgi:hypothetical protein